MKVPDLQEALGVKADGIWGPRSRAALFGKFANLSASGITTEEMDAFAHRLGCSLRQLAAVATVESNGGGFDRDGRPKILYERHVFHRLTNGAFSPSPFSMPTYGGYSDPSWTKLADAAGKNPDAAFSACSWGRFQIMGMHWRKLAYASAFEMAVSSVAGEIAHFEMLARFIEAFGLSERLRRISANPADCEAFARAYNGPDFKRNSYDRKLAAAMK